MSASISTSSRVSNPPNAWIFGALPDLLLGSGLLYLVFISGMILGGHAARNAISTNGWAGRGAGEEDRLSAALPFLERAADLRPDDPAAMAACEDARSQASN